MKKNIVMLIVLVSALVVMAIPSHATTWNDSPPVATEFQLASSSSHLDSISDLRVNAITINSISLSWNESPAATEYEVCYKKTDETHWTLFATTKNTNIEITSLTANTYYDFMVIATARRVRLTEIVLKNQKTAGVDDSSYIYEILPDGTAEIIGYTGLEFHLNVPGMLDGHVVTRIGDEAFFGHYGSPCYFHEAPYRAIIREITLPDSIKSIGTAAFVGLDHLCKVTLPEGLISIGEYAFNGCPDLAEINLPDSLISIGESAFSHCRSLANIDLPANLIHLGDAAFGNCAMTSIIFPSSLTDIGGLIFMNCKKLENIVLPDCLTEIPEYMFSGCNSLNSITIPRNVVSIGDHAFTDCSRLTSLILPNNITSIGDYAFSYCTMLSSINIPASVIYIGDDIFEESPMVTVSVNAGSYAEHYCKINRIQIR